MSVVGRTVVLGGTGYLGAAISRRLARTGPVTSVSRHRGPTSPRVEQVVADVSDPAQARAAVDGASAVVCAVGYSTAATQWRIANEDASARRVNVDAVAEVIRSLERSAVRHSAPPLVVFAGTVAVHDPDTLSGYAAQKREAEQILAEAARRGVVRTVSLQLSTVYGADAAGAGRGVVASWARDALGGAPLRIWSDGSVLRDLVHVDDVARAFALVAGHPGTLRPAYQLGSGVGSRLRWIAERVVAAASRHGARSIIESLPAPAHAAPSDLRDVVTDPTLFSADTAWSARVDPAAGIDHLVARLAQHPPHQKENT